MRWQVRVWALITMTTIEHDTLAMDNRARVVEPVSSHLVAVAELLLSLDSGGEGELSVSLSIYALESIMLLVLVACSQHIHTQRTSAHTHKHNISGI